MPQTIPLGDGAELIAPPSPLAQQAISDLHARFDSPESPHRPSPAQWDALHEIIMTLDDMAHGEARFKFHLASLDPGVGKTTALTVFLKALVNNPDYRSVGAIVFLSRKSEIERLVKEVGLNERQFAVLTRDPECNSLSSTAPMRAQILFTTQQGLEARLERCDGFEAITDYLYQPCPILSPCPRAVRVWDESANPGHALTIDQGDLAGIVWATKDPLPLLSKAIDRMRDEVRLLPHRSSFFVPDFEADFSLGSDAVQACTDDHKIRAAMRLLWTLGGRTVTVRKEGNKQVCLDYEPTFTDDLKPMLILDASGRVRTLYRLWRDGDRADLIHLSDAPKNYKNLNIHAWNHTGSKDSWRKAKKRKAMVDAIVSILNQKPDEEWLVIAHKGDTIRAGSKGRIRGRDPGIEPEVLEGFTGDKAKVKFAEWGRHTATNEHRTVRNVVLAGLLYLPKSIHEANGRAAWGLPSSEGPFEDTTVLEVEKGEHRHNILQALCRANVRNSDGDGCGKCDAYIIAKKQDRVPDMMREVFPGCHVVEWKPKESEASAKLTKKQREALAVILGTVKTAPSNLISFSTIAKAIGMTAKDFRARVRRADRFQEALAGMGVVEILGPKGQSGFREWD